MNTKKLILPLFAVALLGGAATAGIVSLASAQTTTAATGTQSTGGDHGVMGTVSAVNGSTITLTGKDGSTYTVDATKASISKTSTIDVSGVAVGDTLMVGGTVSGTSVTADHIMDGTMPIGMGGGRGGPGMAGKGIMGTVSAVNGTTLTVTETNPKTSAVTTYTVDATSAKVMKGAQGAAPTTSTLSSVAVGDKVAIRGTVTGTNVVATNVMDGVFGFGGHRGGKKNQTGSTASATTTASTTSAQ